MKASVLIGPQTSEVRDVPVPEIGSNDVLIRVKACGVCRSELEQWLGKEGGQEWQSKEEDSSHPVILGHEPAGVIEEVGNAVQGFKKGQAVAVFPGSRGYYTEYKSDGFAEYLAAPEENVTVLPEGIEFQEALGEPLACLFSAFERTPIGFTDRVAIVGCGFMGLAMLQLVRLRNPREIVALDIRKETLDLALRLGADQAVLPEELEPRDKAARWEDKDQGFEVVLEVSGTQPGLTLASELGRAHGTLSIVGYHADGLRQVDVALWNIKALNVINAHEKRRAHFMKCMQTSLELVARKKIAMTPLVTHTYSLDNTDQAYRDLLQKPQGHVKGVVLTP